MKLFCWLFGHKCATVLEALSPISGYDVRLVTRVCDRCGTVEQWKRFITKGRTVYTENCADDPAYPAVDW